MILGGRMILPSPTKLGLLLQELKVHDHPESHGDDCVTAVGLEDYLQAINSWNLLHQNLNLLAIHHLFLFEWEDLSYACPSLYFGSCNLSSFVNKPNMSLLLGRSQIEITPGVIVMQWKLLNKEITGNNFENCDSLSKGGWTPFIWGQVEYLDKGVFKDTCLYIHCMLFK